MQLILKFLSRVKHVPVVQMNYSINIWGQSLKWFLSYDRISNLFEYPIITQEPLDQLASHIYIILQWNILYHYVSYFSIYIYIIKLFAHIYSFVCCQLWLAKRLDRMSWNFLREPMVTLGLTKATQIRNIYFFNQIFSLNFFFSKFEICSLPGATPCIWASI